MRTGDALGLASKYTFCITWLIGVQYFNVWTQKTQSMRTSKHHTIYPEIKQTSKSINFVSNAQDGFNSSAAQTYWKDKTESSTGKINTQLYIFFCDLNLLVHSHTTRFHIIAIPKQHKLLYARQHKPNIRLPTHLGNCSICQPKYTLPVRTSNEKLRWFRYEGNFCLEVRLTRNANEVRPNKSFPTAFSVRNINVYIELLHRTWPTQDIHSFIRRHLCAWSGLCKPKSPGQ